MDSSAIMLCDVWLQQKCALGRCVESHVSGDEITSKYVSLYKLHALVLVNPPRLICVECTKMYVG